MLQRCITADLQYFHRHRQGFEFLDIIADKNYARNLPKTSVTLTRQFMTTDGAQWHTTTSSRLLLAAIL